MAAVGWEGVRGVHGWPGRGSWSTSGFGSCCFPGGGGRGCMRVCKWSRHHANAVRLGKDVWEGDAYQSNLWLAGFPIDFVCGKLPGKVTNGDHISIGHCNSCKYKSVPKCPIVIMWLYEWGDSWNLKGLVVTITHSGSLHNFKRSLN